MLDLTLIGPLMCTVLLFHVLQEVSLRLKELSSDIRNSEEGGL